MLGLQSPDRESTLLDDGDGSDNEAADPSLTPLWAAVTSLKTRSKTGPNDNAWRRATIKRLWQSFHVAMPGLHFLPEKQVFTSPTPLLLVCILYCSSSRGSSDVAIFAPVYYSSLCKEISDLLLPARGWDGWAATEEWAYQAILGIIIATLLSEGSHDATGLWISVAYRLYLEWCPPQLSGTSRQWQKVFSGLQIVDMEHSFLHLQYPSIPLETSLTATRLKDDQLYGISQSMHVGLCHFAGRGLRTIWSLFSASGKPAAARKPQFSGVDAAVMRDWARQLDEWLAHFSTRPFESESERQSIYRQYVMHRLCVLSVYLPSRGCDLFSAEATPQECHELLSSARVTIKLHANDASIWSNWDFIMITWAALLTLQALKGGYGEVDDLAAIRLHLSLLRQTNEPAPNLRHILAERLEQDMQGVREEDMRMTQPMSDMHNANTDYSWALFDQSSLEFVDQYF